MLEVLQFVFSSFWHWLGTVIILAVIGSMIAAAFAAARGR
jgi:hypothetical protein